MPYSKNYNRTASKRDSNDWTQILYRFALGMAPIRVFRK